MRMNGGIEVGVEVLEEGMEEVEEELPLAGVLGEVQDMNIIMTYTKARGKVMCLIALGARDGMPLIIILHRSF